MIAANFDYESPRTLNEALNLLSSREDAKILAGGHSLLPAMKLRLAQPALLVDLGRISGLSYIRESGDKIVIGAMTTHAEVKASQLLRRASPLLALTATQIGDTQVRNRGTLGGSLAQAHPAADYPASVLALDAEIVAQSRSGERIIPATEFFLGMFSTALRSDEILTEVRIPKTASEKVTYKKFHHPASGYAVVGIAVRLKMSASKNRQRRRGHHRCVRRGLPRHSAGECTAGKYCCCLRRCGKPGSPGQGPHRRCVRLGHVSPAPGHGDRTTCPGGSGEREVTPADHPLCCCSPEARGSPRWIAGLPWLLSVCLTRPSPACECPPGDSTSCK